MANESTIQELLESGLHFYGLGEIKKALEIWEEVLRRDPSNETAREFIEIETGRQIVTSPSSVDPAPEEIIEPRRNKAHESG